MLFAYKYVPHTMEKMQEFIDFIFFEVWCKARTSGHFNLELFDDCTELKEVMSAFYYGHTQGGDFFYGHVERIYGLFAELAQEQIDQFILWYRANNDIERVCANDSAVHIARYSDLMDLHPDLGRQLASFFKGLYCQKLLNLEVLRKIIGQIDEHYQAFMTVNQAGKCPFCGITDMLGVYHTKREAYDHYLPKGLYPFNSINFKNLVPACHYCNSSYKTTKDPSYAPKDPAQTIHRRKAFYPYAVTMHTIEVKIEFASSNIDSLEPSDIELSFGPAAVHEEIETWRDVYGIDERYKGKCCSETDGKYWLTQVLDEWKNDDRSPSDFMRTLTRNAARAPLADTNFLRKAFLEGCQRIGVLEE